MSDDTGPDPDLVNQAVTKGELFLVLTPMRRVAMLTHSLLSLDESEPEESRRALVEELFGEILVLNEKINALIGVELDVAPSLEEGSSQPAGKTVKVDFGPKADERSRRRRERFKRLRDARSGGFALEKAEQSSGEATRGGDIQQEAKGAEGEQNLSRQEAKSAGGSED